MLLDAVVLAGGGARRLGGVSKAEVTVGGRALLDHVLEAAAGARAVVVVGPPALGRPGVLLTSEDPPGGGPVAGLAAGLDALDSDARARGVPPAALVLVLACDVPLVARAVPHLVTAALDGRHDGAQLVDAAGRRQPLVAVYRRASLDAGLAGLAARGGARDASVRALVAGMTLVEVLDDAAAADADTWEDVRRLDAVLGAPGQGAHPDDAARPDDTADPDDTAGGRRW